MPGPATTPVQLKPLIGFPRPTCSGVAVLSVEFPPAITANSILAMRRNIVRKRLMSLVIVLVMALALPVASQMQEAVDYDALFKI